MDEYERAAREFRDVVASLGDDEYVAVCDPTTTDESCRTFQTIATHVVSAGYGYSTLARRAFGVETERPTIPLLDREAAVAGVDAFLAHTVETLDGRWRMPDEEIDAMTIRSGWGVTYNLEQLLEHAVCHVLRHRRQIERLRSR